MITPRPLSRKSLCLSTAIALSLTVTGCAGMQNIGSVLPGGYISDSSDACIAQRRTLDASGQTFESELLRNAIISTLVGAAAAAVVGENVFLGAGIGLAAGLAGTYIFNLQKEYKTGSDLTNAAIQDIRKENARIDLLLTNFDAVVACRKREGDSVREALAAGTIDRPTAVARMEQIRIKYREDVAHTRKIAENISERSTSYAAVYNQIAADNGGKALVVEDYKPGSYSEAGPPVQVYEALKGSNVRSGPGTNFKKVGTLARREQVTVIGEDGDWYQIEQPGVSQAYVAKFLIGPIGTAKPAPKRSKSAKVIDQIAEKPVKDEKIQPVVLAEDDKMLIGELQETCLTNVEKRDQSFDRIETAAADEDDITDLS